MNPQLQSVIIAHASSINRKIQEQIKENKILEKQKVANAEALINNILSQNLWLRLK
jgi:hypothetical protein